MRILFIVLLIGLFTVSCNKEVLSTKQLPEKVKNDTTILKIKTHLPVQLNAQAKEEMSNWLEYQNLSEFIPNLYKTDTKQALFDSQRILELSKQLKDSIRIKKMDIPSFRARLHVLYNESLRLADMDSIKSITPEEVVLQTKNIVNAYDAINSKINMLISQERLEENLKEFDSIINKQDSTKKDFKPFLKPKKQKEKRKIKRLNPLLKRTKHIKKSNKVLLDKLKRVKKREKK